MTTATPAVYVGTYHKYNSGSLYGKWLELDDFINAQEFYQACTATHWDEEDPELMFQDWEGIPEQFICESGLKPEYWDYLEAIEHSYLDAEVFEAAAELDIPFDMVEELYQSQYDSDEDFAYQMADDLGMAPDGNDWPSSYIDWGRAARDLMMDYGESNGHYFRTSY
jgi:antirestriction protein